MRIAFLGTPAFAVPVLDRLADSQHDVAVVVTQPDRPAGRGRTLTPPPVKLAAERLGLPVVQPDRIGDHAGLEALRRAAVDVAVVAAYGEVLTADTLAAPARGFLNVHPSLLPRLRGATPVPTAILEGLDYTGVTIMQVSRGVDAGPLLAQVGEPIRDDDTGETLLDRLAHLGAELLLATIDRWERGEVLPHRQDHRSATYSRTLRRGDGLIDWSTPAVDLWRRCRAFQPWPGFHTAWRGQSLKILSCAPMASRGGRPPGHVFASPEGPAVACRPGALLLRQVQAEGRRAMPAEEFLRGHPDLVGSSLGN